MYNVLEKIKEQGRPRPEDRPLAVGTRGKGAPAPCLTPKETATHDAGLVSVLRQLHDELDAPVASTWRGKN